MTARGGRALYVRCREVNGFRRAGRCLADGTHNRTDIKNRRLDIC
jgi:hypothetical protein